MATKPRKYSSIDIVNRAREESQNNKVALKLYSQQSNASAKKPAPLPKRRYRSDIDNDSHSDDEYS